MTFDDIKRFYKGVDKARAALGIKSRQTLYNWRDSGIPHGEQCRIQILTRGAMKADKNAVKGAAGARARAQ